ncbi:hypothetical protein GCM10029964_120810 [Kibdelosporangium lantanae]
MGMWHTNRLVTPYTEIDGDEVHGRHIQVKPAWVDLEALFGPEPDRISTVPDGLNLRGRVPGQVSGWFRSDLGAWLAVVHYDIPYRDGRRATVRVTDQVVPARAVQPQVGR